MDKKVTHSKVEEIFPLGYDSRRHPRFSLVGGGYTIASESDDSWFDAFRPTLQLNVRDISLGGAGGLCRSKIGVGRHLIFASPSGYLLRSLVVRSMPDPLFPKLFRIGLRWCQFPPHKVFQEWQDYIREEDMEMFMADVAILIETGL